MKSVTKWLKNNDIFGKPITLTLKNHDKFKTVFGGFITLGLTIFFSFFIAYSIYKLLTYGDFKSSRSNLNLGDSYGFLEFDERTLNFAVRFQTQVLNNWTNPYVNLTFWHVTQFRNLNGTFKVKEQLQSQPCQVSNFPGLESEFQLLRLNQALCLGNNSNLTLQGNYQEEVFSYFQIKVTSCTNPDVCQDNNTIYEAAKAQSQIELEFFISNPNIDEKNIHHPITKHIVSDMYSLVDLIRPIYKKADIYLDEVVIRTDQGYFPTLFPNEYRESTFTYSEDYREQVTIGDLSAAQFNIGDFYFRKSQNKISYMRSLGDVMLIVSFLGSAWSSCIVIMTHLLNSYHRNYFILAISNKLYDFPSQKKKKSEEELKKAKGTINETKGVSKNIIDKIINYLSYSEKLKISCGKMYIFLIRNIFSFFTCCDNNDKYSLLKHSEQSLLQDLDICNILNKLQEFDKIKSLLFTKDQETVLSFTPKPKILTYSHKLKKNTSGSLRDLLKTKGKEGRVLTDKILYDSMLKFENLIFAWKTLKNEIPKPLMINQKIIQMFDENIRNIIDIPEEDLKYCISRSKGIYSMNTQNKIKNDTEGSSALFSSSPPEKLMKNFSEVKKEESNEVLLELEEKQLKNPIDLEKELKNKEDFGNLDQEIMTHVLNTNKSIQFNSEFNLEKQEMFEKG